MKVWIVEAMPNIAYDQNSWIEKVFSTEQSANTYVAMKDAEQAGWEKYEQYIYLVKEWEVESEIHSGRLYQ